MSAVVVGAAERDADADADADLGVPQEHRLRDGLHHPARDVLRLAEILEVLEQHRELVTTQPRHGVGAPHAATRAIRDRQQHVVAANVAQLVIDRLEAVDVREQDRDPAGPRSPRARAWFRRSVNSARLASRVSPSWKAWRRSSSCSRAFSRAMAASAAKVPREGHVRAPEGARPSG